MKFELGHKKFLIFLCRADLYLSCVYAYYQGVGILEKRSLNKHHLT